MAKLKKRSAPATPPPGYLTVQRRRLTGGSTVPVAAAQTGIPSTARWRLVLDKTCCLLQMVANEMQAYSDGRTPSWHETPGAILFHECMDELYNIEGVIDDIRSNF